MALLVAGFINRFRASNVDISEITPRIFACGPPRRRKTVERSNAVADLAAMLNKEHDRNYMLWSFGGDGDEDVRGMLRCYRRSAHARARARHGLACHSYRHGRVCVCVCVCMSVCVYIYYTT